MKPIILILSIFFSMSLFAQNAITKTLETNPSTFPKSKVFIKTDKDVYGQGEKIWFKAEVLNCLTEAASTEAELVLMIKTESGKVITDNKFIIENGIVNSCIPIPSWASSGNAFIIAYTPNAISINEASLAAIKPITINKLKNRDYVIDVSFNKMIYKAGENAELTIKLKSLTTISKKEKILISLFDYHKLIFSSKENVLVNSENIFTFKLPSNIESGLYFMIETIGKETTSVKKSIYTNDDRLNIEFFVEGGHLLTNTIQRIVYRATNPFGNPINATGKIIDPMGNEVGAGRVLKTGFGMINLLPSPNQQYTLIVDSNYGKGQKFSLPMVNQNGTAFTILKTETDVIKAAIYNAESVIGKQLNVVALSSGHEVLSFSVEAKKRNTINISTAQLPEGIVTFVVTDQQNNVLSERMLYNAPIKDVDIDIKTKITEVENTNKVKLTIDANDFIRQFGASSFEVKVVDQQNLYKPRYKTSRNFLEYPLLTPAPKTVLDIYITNVELIANRNKYYNISDLLRGHNYFENKNNESKLTGIVTDKSGNVISNATVMLTQSDNATVNTSTNSSGKFTFRNIPKQDDFVIKAISETGKKTYEVHIDQSFEETLDYMLLVESLNVPSAYSGETTPKYYNKNKGLLNAIGNETKDKRLPRSSNIEMMLKSGSSILDVIKMIKAYSILNDQIVFYGSSNSLMCQEGALIVIDGIKMGTDISALNSITPSDVESINVSTDPIDIQRYTALNSVGIIEIKTKKAVFAVEDNSSEKHIQSFDYTNFTDDVWKYQTTLLWAPGLLPNSNGIIEIEFKKSSIKSVFNLEIEAIATLGKHYVHTEEFSTKE